MLVDIKARIQETSSLAPNHPAGDWPIRLRVDQSNGERQKILECEGKIRASELQAVVTMPGVLAPDEAAVPQFVKNLMARRQAEIQCLEVPDSGIQMLSDLASHSFL
jgi:hypothetical protein